MSIRILQGDCVEVMKTLDANSIDAIVTDPPYGIGFMGKAWDHADIVARAEKRASMPHAMPQPNGTPRKTPRTAPAEAAGSYDLTPAGMSAFQDFSREWAEQALRVLKPGGHLLCFASTRTYHRMASGVEDAGFEVRDQAGWMFGSGFPKSRNLDGDWQGWGTALKPAWEPICVARKPLAKGCTVAANVLKHGTGAINIDGCRVDGGERPWREPAVPMTGEGSQVYGSFAKEGSRAVDNTTLGRWPANLLHDGSDEVVALFPQSAGQLADISSTAPSAKTSNVYGAMKREGEPSQDSDNNGTVGFKMKPGARRLDEGSAARFFWCPKTSSADRHDGLQHPGPQFTSGSTLRDAENLAKKGNHHPTVKPTELMRYLCRLVTPPGGTVLDPFMGSGSTLKAAELEGFNAIGIELDPGYIEIARRRIAADAPLFADVQT